MKRTPMNRGTGFKRPERPARQPVVLAKATRRAVYARCDAPAAPQPKDPHTVNPHFRNLARGEVCTGLRYGGYCHCDPATTVLAHPNTLSANKGMGYKANDHEGAFLGMDCHAWLDQGDGTAEEKAALMKAAQARTLDRCHEIATDKKEKPWRRKAAQWAVDLNGEGA